MTEETTENANDSAVSGSRQERVVMKNTAIMTVTFHVPTTSEPTDKHVVLEEFLAHHPGYFIEYINDVSVKVISS